MPSMSLFSRSHASPQANVKSLYTKGACRYLMNSSSSIISCAFRNVVNSPNKFCAKAKKSLVHIFQSFPLLGAP